MGTQLLKNAFLSAAICLSMTAAATAQERYLLDPPGNGAGSTPRLGFYGQMQYGRGMVVNAVNHGSLAERLGLEPGDVIVKVNHCTIRSDHDWRYSLQGSGGYIRLLVDDVQGRGLLWTRTIRLDNGSGAVQPRR